MEEKDKITKKEERKREVIINSEGEDNGGSYFDGDPWKFFFLKLGLFLLKVITLWIAQPYCEVVKNKYELSHTVIDGRRLAFNGSAISIFGYNMLWNFLSVITGFILTIYKFMKMKSWVVKHTVFEDTEELVTKENEDEYESKFSGTMKEWIKISLKSMLVTLLSLFFLTPLGIYWVEDYSKNNTYISGHRLSLDLSFPEFYNKWIKWMFLSIVTFGVYLVFLNVKQRRYLIKYTHIAA